MNLLEAFDVKQYLDDKAIYYSESGKNVSSGWIGINCLYCPDPSTHLGIHLKTKIISCFKCGATGNVFKLIRDIEQKTENSDVIQILKKYQDPSYQFMIDEPIERAPKVHLPIGCTKDFPGIFQDYFKKRRFNLEELIQKYDLFACHISSDFRFKYKVIVPIRQSYKLVTYLGRDVTEKSPVKYQACPETDSVKTVKECLYNIDSISNRKAIVVEGVTDVWRLGNGAVATFGTKFTSKQISLLAGLNQVFVMFDSDAIDQSYKLANELSGVVRNVEVIELKNGDPADLSQKDAKDLKKELLGYE